MDIKNIDKNFIAENVKEPDVVWHSVKEDPFKIYGVFYDEEYGGYLRLPKSVATATSGGVAVLSESTAGGRIRFKTDSKYVAVKCYGSTTIGIMHHMPICGTFGIAYFSDGIFKGHVTPTANAVENPIDGKICFDGKRNLDGKLHEIELYFPLYNGMKEIYVGLAEGCSVLPPEPYKHEGYVLFYGSSITQGGCASHSGNDYVSIISRTLNTDVLNLGMSGSARGEKAIAEYMANLSPSVYVLDYDYNANDAQHLKETHLPLYRAIREKHKDTPIIFISNPNFNNPPDDVRRREVILDTYRISLEEGDKNTAFIDGEHLFGAEYKNYCTMDTIHPNDLGFYRMAVGIAPVVKKYLK